MGVGGGARRSAGTSGRAASWSSTAPEMVRWFGRREARAVA